MERRRPTGGRSGQTLIEYVIVAGMLLAATSVLAVFLYTFKQSGGRTIELIAYEYP